MDKHYTIDGCTNAQFSRSWCQKHYARWLRHGDPLHVRVPRSQRTKLQCSRCKETKDPSEFYKRGGAEGERNCYRSLCKVCMSNASKEWRKNGGAEAQAEWQRNNKDRRSEYSRRYYEANREAYGAYARRRRALLRGVTVELVRPAVVYERDGWCCGICRQPVDPDVSFPHPESPSLDHIIPLAKGGEHSYRNVQLAHLQCNRMKSDRILEVVSAA